MVNVNRLLPSQEKELKNELKKLQDEISKQPAINENSREYKRALELKNILYGVPEPKEDGVSRR